MKAFEQPVETWRRELKAAGWMEVHRTMYRAPDDTYHLGPYGAWLKMKDGRHAVSASES